MMERLSEQLRWWATECDRTNYGCQARKSLVEAADRLAYYEDMEEQGRLVVLPCKVGDTVYFIAHQFQMFPKYYWERVIVEYTITSYADYFTQTETLGKTVFLTREDAERALKEGADHE